MSATAAHHCSSDVGEEVEVTADDLKDIIKARLISVLGALALLGDLPELHVYPAGTFPPRFVFHLRRKTVNG